MLVEKGLVVFIINNILIFNARDAYLLARPVLSLARNKVGSFPILIKINCDDFVEGGISKDTFAEFVQEIETTGVDAIEVSGGMWDCLVRSEEELGSILQKSNPIITIRLS